MFLSCKETVIIFIVHIFFFQTWRCVCFFLVVCNPDCDWFLFSDSAIDQGSDGRQCMCGKVRHWEVSVPVLLEVPI